LKNLIQKLRNFNINSRPHSFALTKLKQIDSDISDLFTYILDDYETIFIGENSLALMLASPIECVHIFHFFDKSGSLINVHETKSSDFHFKLLITKYISGGSKFGSFTHHIRYSNIIMIQYKKLLDEVSFQHRGYTGYRNNLNSGFSYVHGNFGGMYISKNKKIKSLARSRVNFTYTPQLIIKPNFNYEFIFSNPTNKNSIIKFFLIEKVDLLMLKEICLAPYASVKFTLDDFDLESETNISWQTNLPISRCIVFERLDKYFDVFHS